MRSHLKEAQTDGLPLAKLNGAGNDFLIIDWRDRAVRGLYRKIFGASSRSFAARALCQNHFSLGADGLLFLEDSKIADLKWDFYNADGSRAEMCGNAARVVGRYALDRAAHLTLETRAGVVTISAEAAGPGQFRVEMPPISEFEMGHVIGTGAKKIFFDFVNSGVPHAVVYWPKAKNIKALTANVNKLAETVDNIRALKKFKKHGTNVTFYSTADGRDPAKSKSPNICSLTFERGVSGYTLACGTGVVAAAYSFSQKRLAPSKVVRVRAPGGELKVELLNRRPHLIGPAKFNARLFFYES